MRTASIEVKSVEYLVANIAKMTFDKGSIKVYGDLNTENEIKNAIVAETKCDKAFLKIVKVERDNDLSGLYELSEKDYVTFGKRVGDVRPKKEKEEKASK